MNTKVLLVMSPEKQHPLLAMLESSGFQVVPSVNLLDAQQKLSTPVSYDLLFVDAELRDGTWNDLLQFVLESGRNCEMIVCARCGDEQLWGEVIQRGAYDLICEPYEEREVARIANSALDSQYMKRFVRHAEARAS